MPKKKLEVVELNKNQEQIVLEEKQNKWSKFWGKYGKLIYIISLIISLTTLIVSVLVTVFNLSTSDKPTIKEVSIDTDLTNSSVVIDTAGSLTTETAKNTFANKKSIFKSSGEVLLLNTIETDEYTLNFYSDYTAIKIMKKMNLITRIKQNN